MNNATKLDDSVATLLNNEILTTNSQQMVNGRNIVNDPAMGLEKRDEELYLKFLKFKTQKQTNEK